MMNFQKMASNLTNQVRSISRVTKAVAYGDLNKMIEVDVSGEMLDLKVTINEMVERLGNFSSEVTRVALEVREWGVMDLPSPELCEERAGPLATATEGPTETEGPSVEPGDTVRCVRGRVAGPERGRACAMCARWM